MKTLVLYDSQFGNTELVAQSMAQACREFGPAHAVRVDRAQHDDIAGVDVLIIGCPTQAWRLTPATGACLERNGDDMRACPAVTSFDTRFNGPRWLTGSAARSIARRLVKMSVSLVQQPESFLVEGREGPLLEGELGRAAAWARDLTASLAH